MRRYVQCMPLLWLSWAMLVIGSSACGSAPASSASSDELTSEGNSSQIESAQSGYTATRYPIVLIPGFLGFTEILGTVEYFAGVADALEESGARAYQVSVSQAATSPMRANQIILQLDALRNATGAAKFNLIGHSQGGFEARVVAAIRPDLVASITTVGSPHGGTSVATSASAIPLGVGSAAVGALADFFRLLSGSSDANDAKAVLEFLSPSSMHAFNAVYPAGLPTTPCGEGPAAVNGIPLYSWGGVAWLTNPVDLLDPVWLLFGMQTFEANDGLVPRCGSHFGQVIRDDYPYNHIDEANMIFGLVMPLGPNPKSLYRAQANRLQNVGM
jgi:triacylglycerol lipase